MSLLIHRSFPMPETETILDWSSHEQTGLRLRSPKCLSLFIARRSNSCNFLHGNRPKNLSVVQDLGFRSHCF